MILLNTSAVSAFNYLASVPTHALCTSVFAIYQPWTNGVQSLKLNYQLGTIVDSEFVLNSYVPTVEVTLPTPYQGELHDAEYALLKNLFTGTGKSAFDFTMNELDTLCSENIPNLAGTVV